MSVAYNNGGLRLASGPVDGAIKRWDMSNDGVPLQSHEHAIIFLSLTYNNDGSCLHQDPLTVRLKYGIWVMVECCNRRSDMSAVSVQLYTITMDHASHQDPLTVR